MSNAEPSQNEVNGAMLRAMRTAAGLSIAELARRADVGSSHLSHYEAGRKGMDPDRLKRVRSALVELMTEPK